MEEHSRLWGMIPTSTACVEEALSHFEDAIEDDTFFDVIISDNSMPGQSGTDFVKTLRDRNVETPFILLSSGLSDEGVENIEALRAFQQLSKPVISTQLYTAVQSSLIPQRRISTTSSSISLKNSDQSKNSKIELEGEVLVVEDNAINKLYVTTILSQQGFKYRVASNGLEAIQAIRERQFAVVLMDCQMPELDGFEATRLIRNLEKEGRIQGHVPVIALTANAVKGDAERCQDAGMDSYLSKPFEPQSLREKIEKYARQKSEPSDDVDNASITNPDSLNASSVQCRSNQASAEPPINAEALYERCLYDVDFMCSLLAELETMGPNRLADIAKQVEREDCLQASNAAHALKGAAALMGAEPIRRLTSSIEEIGRTGTLEGMPELVAELTTEMQRCLEFLPTVYQFARDKEIAQKD
jgi:Amt family ammonium transporter